MHSGDKTEINFDHVDKLKISLNNRLQYEALGNNYRVCGVYSPEPLAEVLC